ncbi:proton-conducting transporter membrane subunit [Amaricoccus sp.]|uniref:proton-conducting transporter transmembrane domain-containing protein n=1 Tax=Amaricoccus sp. TaxID=1872485 RepID=UPI001B4BCA06|nr:proton-conducting transporter membrane subunit [Amaricoccus sp.]MBP7242289.1 Na+/H+ antiporter subunit D [Amaricoccus sp.]
MLLFLPVAVPFATAVLALLARRVPRASRAVSLLGAGVLVAVAAAILVRTARQGPFAMQAGGWPAPFGITFVADLLSASLVALTAVVAVATIVFGFADVDEEQERLGHHALVHAMLAGICGAFLTGDIFNMYVWFEVMLISSFGLLVIGGGRAQLDGAAKYVGLNLIATVAFIAGVGLLYGATGALNMADLHARLAGRTMETPILVSAAFLVFAFGSKAAAFPMFFWLPASYHTPSFATSAVFAALLTKVGVYAMLRVFTLVYGIEGTAIQTLLLWLAVLSMVVGALGALVQGTMRRMLGYGVISSVGYMLLGLALSSPLALAGSVFYLLQDVPAKAALFMSAGLAQRSAGSEAFDHGGGLWRAQPWAAALFLVPALSLAGMPPFAGFWAKLMLAQATLAAASYGLALAVLGVGLLTLLAVARVWNAVYWAAAPGVTVRPAPAAMIAPIAAFAAALLVAGVIAGPGLAAAQAMAAGLLDPAAYLAAVLGVGG